MMKKMMNNFQDPLFYLCPKNDEQLSEQLHVSIFFFNMEKDGMQSLWEIE